MYRKRLEEMNVLDDFLFGSIVSDPLSGEEFCRTILGIILGREIGEVRVFPQKYYYGIDSDLHGIRVDVCLEEENTARGEAAIYDIEPDKNSKKELIAALPRRVRFYHSKIDGFCLEAGDDYENLKRVLVILITPYDPFNQNHMVYTIKNTCVEIPGLPYEDGARTIFLYTRGTRGNPSEELKSLLRYMEDSKEENATDQTLRRLHTVVDRVKHNREVSLNYMKIFEQEKLMREEAHEEGLAEGLAEGQRKGEERLLSLLSCLLKDGRSFNVEKLRSDKSLRENLYREYNL